jgi:predicted DNA binding CopG/RHH family protein
MKKRTETTVETTTRTTKQAKNHNLSRTERERLKRLAALPDDQIDTSDIAEMKEREGWVRVHEHPEHPLHRTLSRLLSIRVPEADIALAQRLAASKGLPYQTYMKSLLHEALERERVLAERSGRD